MGSLSAVRAHSVWMIFQSEIKSSEGQNDLFLNHNSLFNICNEFTLYNTFISTSFLFSFSIFMDIVFEKSILNFCYFCLFRVFFLSCFTNNVNCLVGFFFELVPTTFTVFVHMKMNCIYLISFISSEWSFSVTFIISHNFVQFKTNLSVTTSRCYSFSVFPVTFFLFGLNT